MRHQICQTVPVVSGGPIGPLYPRIADFTTFLVERGYSVSSIDHRRRLVIALDRWFVQHRIGLKGFDDDRIEQFLRDRRKQCSVQYADPPTLRCFLNYLRNAKVVPFPATTRNRTPLDRLQASFTDYLTEERGLKEKTRDQYLKVTRSFLGGCFRNKPILLHELNQRNIAKFVLGQANAISPITAQQCGERPPELF